MKFWFYNFFLLYHSSELPPSNNIANYAGHNKDIFIIFINVINNCAVFTEPLKVILTTILLILVGFYLVFFSNLLNCKPPSAFILAKCWRNKPLVPIFNKLEFLDIQLKLVLSDFSGSCVVALDWFGSNDSFYSYPPLLI